MGKGKNIPWVTLGLNFDGFENGFWTREMITLLSFFFWVFFPLLFFWCWVGGLCWMIHSFDTLLLEYMYIHGHGVQTFLWFLSTSRSAEYSDDSSRPKTHYTVVLCTP
ncbi:uncharacterized protein EURHEDRAFT_171335 [Aspergillus ruber CBS 135680]|uniref:Uncharacterized protein n=1 Tax=Aspergillus ruber (strain CBS 135680) TaxID=1388766 RepID=A0A017S7W1_ASPRC|nr:uncharacterized protein EURHEDRAFT_171335 [Aspergillus ruber CBS 135680]EYE92926.1 hypothetical protein EURHEDRAFT_171335 [Aspergillus ruber CBS 135680]